MAHNNSDSLCRTQRTAQGVGGGGATGSTDTAWRLAGGWKGGGFTVNLTWENLKFEDDNVVVGQLKDTERNAWALGTSYGWDNHSVRARYSKANNGGALNTPP